MKDTQSHRKRLMEAPDEIAGSSRLLALPDDGQRVIFSLLSDALRPAVVLNLSACCRELRAVSEVARAELRRQHSAATRLCARANTTIHEVLGSTDLLWYGQGLTVQHLATLGRCLSTSALSHLEQLNLSVNRFGAEGAIALFDALGRGSLPRLTVLDLTGNVMGAAGAAALAAALARGALPRLEILTLGRNEIGDAGLVALAPPLRRMPALREVYLYGNQIGDAGVEALLSNLGREQLKRLQTLNLERNQIDDAGCTTLIAALGGTAWPYRLTAPPPLEALKIENSARCEADEGRCRCRWQGFGVGSLTD